MSKASKKTPGQKARELVKRHTGQEPVQGSNKLYVVVNGEILSWYEYTDGTVTSVHSRRVGDEPDSNTDYFPGQYHDTIEAGIKSVTCLKARETGDQARAILGWYGAVDVDLCWKPGAGFVRQAVFTVRRFVAAPPDWTGVKSRFLSVAFVLRDDEAVSMAREFIAGSLPAGILLDWLQDRDQKGVPKATRYGRQPKNPEVACGELEALLALPAGEKVEAA